MSLNSVFSQVFEHKFTFSPHQSYFGHCLDDEKSMYVLFLPLSKFMILPITASFKTMSLFQQGQNLSKTVKDSGFCNDPRKPEPEWNMFSWPVTLQTIIKLIVTFDDHNAPDIFLLSPKSTMRDTAKNLAEVQ